MIIFHHLLTNDHNEWLVLFSLINEVRAAGLAITLRYAFGGRR